MAASDTVIVRTGAPSDYEDDIRKHAETLRWRIAVWHETVAMDTAAPYPCTPSTKHVFDPLYIFPKLYDGTFVSVVPEDVLDVAQAYIKQNPLVLNFADDLDPGGCVDGGSGAQEESLFRRTNLYRTVHTDFYPLKSLEAVYSPVITVFRAPEARNYAILEAPYTVAVVSAPALKYPPVRNGRLRDADVQTLKRKIRLVFQIAKQHGHEVLVLGAWGCGAWRNPPAHVAEVFRAVLREYSGVFHSVVFACLHTPSDAFNERPSSYSIFQQILMAEF